LEHRPGQGVANEMLKAPPRPFQFLKVFMVHDLVHLSGNEPIYLSDSRVNGDIHILGHRQLAAHYLTDEFADHVLRPLFLEFVAAQPALGQDLVKETAFLFDFNCFSGGALCFLLCHTSYSSFASASLNSFCLSALDIMSSSIVSSFSLPSILERRSA